MCVIAVADKRRLTKEEFESCFKANSDGVGIGWSKGELNFYIKGLMEKDEAWATYQKIDILPHVVHFRISTAGGVCKELTHPFIVSPTSPIKTSYKGKLPLLFHNGVMGDWEKYLVLIGLTDANKKIPEGKYNDSRVAAMLEGRVPGILDVIKGSSKWAYIKDATVHMFGDFQEEKGVFFSNATYKRSTYSVGHWDKSKNVWVNDYEDGYSSMYGWSKKDTKDAKDAKKDTQDYLRGYFEKKEELGYNEYGV